MLQNLRRPLAWVPLLIVLLLVVWWAAGTRPRVHNAGEGEFRLAESHWFGSRSGREMARELDALAAEFCTGRGGALRRAQASNFNSRGYNSASLRFSCVVTAAAPPP